MLSYGRTATYVIDYIYHNIFGNNFQLFLKAASAAIESAAIKATTTIEATAVK